MNHSIDSFCRQMGRVTLGLLYATLSVLGVAFVCAIFGLSRGASSLGSVAFSLGYAFLAVFMAFLAASFVGAGIRWLDRRKVTKDS